MNIVGLKLLRANKTKKPSYSGKLLMGSPTNLLQTRVYKQHNAVDNESIAALRSGRDSNPRPHA